MDLDEVLVEEFIVRFNPCLGIARISVDSRHDDELQNIISAGRGAFAANKYKGR